MGHEKWLEQHDRMMADHDREIAEIRKELGRAVKLSVQNTRSERKRREELDQKVTQLAAAQLVTEELLQAFLKRGGNGKH
jgi:hypothetical protein